MSTLLNPDLPRNQQCFQKWESRVYQLLQLSKEQQVFLDLIKHYQDDYDTIAYEMYRSFGNKVFMPSHLKRVFVSLQPDDDFTPEESKKLIKYYQAMIIAQKRHVQGKSIQKQFPRFHIGVITKKFQVFIQDLLRKFIFFYASDEKRHFFETRTQRLSLLQYNSIFFFGQKTPNNVEQTNSPFVDICDACKKLINLINEWTNLELYYLDDAIKIDKFLKNQCVQQISEQDFEIMMERILTLDTIHRICFGGFPYRQLDDEQVLYDPIVELDYEEIPERKIIKIGFSFLHKNRRDNQNKNQQLDYLQQFYPNITSDQLRCITLSDTVEIILPYMTLQQRDCRLKQQLCIILFRNRFYCFKMYEKQQLKQKR